MKMPFVVYKHFSKAGELLYIGQTKNMVRRHYDHKHTSAWANEIHYIEIRRCRTRDCSMRIERHAIVDLHPKYNYCYNHTTEKPFIHPLIESELK